MAEVGEEFGLRDISGSKGLLAPTVKREVSKSEDVSEVFEAGDLGGVTRRVRSGSIISGLADLV